MAKKKQEGRYFSIEHIPAKKLDALLFATEQEGHKLVWLRAERVGTTTSYEYTAIFEGKPKPKDPISPFTTVVSWESPKESRENPSEPKE